jgi:heme oxygenase
MIGNFSAPDAQVALLTFTDTTIASRLQHPLAQEKFRELVDLVEPKLARRRFKELAEAIRGFGGPLARMADDARMKKLLGALAA